MLIGAIVAGLGCVIASAAAVGIVVSLETDQPAAIPAAGGPSPV